MGRAQQFVTHFGTLMNKMRFPQGRGKNAVMLIGIASDHHSGDRRARLGPQRIREALKATPRTEAGRAIEVWALEDAAADAEHASVLNADTHGLPGQSFRLLDAGDLEFDDEEAADPQVLHDCVMEIGRTLNAANVCPIFVGGDRGLTFPAFTAMASTPRLNLGHRDTGDTKGGTWTAPGDAERPSLFMCGAWPDLDPPPEGGDERWPVDCTVGKILASRLVDRVVQFGTRSNTVHGMSWWQEFGQVSQFPAEQLDGLTGHERGNLLQEEFVISPSELAQMRTSTRRVYASIDLSVLDPSVAPCAGRPSAAGLTARETLSIIKGMRRWDYTGVDVVGCCPDDSRDPAGITYLVAARIIAEMLPKMAMRGGRPSKIDVPKQQKKQPLPWVL
eukprot:TRINITY_DN35374_c0_g1_i1.p1 TRINITY_DN35374_c0_g1~~TRINITY_DN35374_c0_g1_i1.p1  ORF type:complete len:412 (+),score=119.31 TRINITY_DN35374_c0_g1_i1:68-1237(+)